MVEGIVIAGPYDGKIVGVLSQLRENTRYL